MFTKEFWMDLVERVISTFAETFVGCVTIGAGFGQIDWVEILSISGVAAVTTLLKAFIKQGV